MSLATPAFCPWYSLGEAHAHAPPEPGVLQLRVRTGLIDYARGKSAMILYQYCEDVQREVAGLIHRHQGRDWLCRHVSGSADEMAALYELVLERFIRRFGAAPALPQTSESGHEAD